MNTILKLTASLAMSTMLVMSASARELQLAVVPPEETPWGQAFLGFGELVKQASGGELTIKLFPNAQLGQEDDVLRQMVRGRIDMVSVSNTAMSLILPEIGLLSAPYIFETHAQSDCAYDKLADTFEEPLADAGAVVLAWVEVGNQIIMTKETLIKGPADIVGQKIRSAPTASDTLFLEEAKSSPIPMNVAETMQGLQTGAISGAAFPTIFAVAGGFVQVAPQVSVTNHRHQVGGLLISREIWDGLSEEEQGWLMDAGKKAFGSMRTAIREAEIGLLKKAGAEGANIYHPNDEEMSEWKAIAKTAHPKIVDASGPNATEVWKAIEDAVAACE